MDPETGTRYAACKDIAKYGACREEDHSGRKGNRACDELDHVCGDGYYSHCIQYSIYAKDIAQDT